MPSLGGKLAIANCLAFVGIILLAMTGYLEPDGGERILHCVMMFLSLPLAFPFLIPSMGPPTAIEIIVACLAIGINSFAWGYGLAWMISKRLSRRNSAKIEKDQ